MSSTSLSNLPQMKREPLHDQVYQALCQQLMEGAFEQGQKLPVRPIADSLNTSIAPVREALARLLSEGALEATASGAVFVPIMTSRRFKCLMRIRLALEGMAAELAVPQLTTEEISQIKTLSRDTEAAFQEGPEKMLTYLKGNQEFHFALYAGAKDSPELTRLIQSLWLQTGPFLRSVPLYEIDVYNYHIDIVAGLEVRDAAAVRKALEDDLRHNAMAMERYTQREE